MLESFPIMRQIGCKHCNYKTYSVNWNASEKFCFEIYRSIFNIHFSYLAYMMLDSPGLKYYVFSAVSAFRGEETMESCG